MSKKLKVKYFSDKIERLRYIDGKSDWIDLRAAQDVSIKAGHFRMVPLGVAIQLPEGYEAQTAKVQAEKDREVALIQAQKDKEAAAIKAETEVIEAEAAADVARIAAEAEAEANRKIAASITPELIEKIKYERWNGAVPKVSSSGGTIVGIDGIE